MAKQLNVNLAFTADTSQAKQNILNLQKSLNELSSIQPTQGLALNKDIQSAISSAKELQTHLNNALNTNTGNLDLSKLNASLKASNTNIEELGANLLKAGIQGEEAFMNVQKAIATSSVQLKQANGLLTEFWTSLKNTARWQLSSSVLHAFVGSLQKAYGYAQNLDESLNNIRIVTGYNSDKMAEFAEQANKAAKALSTTTTNYTNASLIYYQQGLTDKEVQERTDVTIKMANAAGESATKVSDQLTAVWNNFYDGSKSLEYYADVMTKLGAATASSTDEIAEGLEKFAAIADTVGLSYEYATAALATVTSNTRQSADVVGTAFKTIFARMQDLELGDTLDDGTTLGSYSEALAKVGINVLDTNGNLVEMDDLLDSIAAKWGDLSKAQQVSLAQSVAGVRQYTQLVALMDNWDAGDADSMVANLGYVSGAEGSLQEQADIYAESWEAARDRVTAALQGIYNDLIPTDFLIKMTDALADVLSGVDTFIEGIGGISTILLLISSIALQKMGPSLAAGINLGVQKASELKISLDGITLKGRSTANEMGQIREEISKAVLSSNGLEENIAYFNAELKEGASNSLKTAQSLNESALESENLTTAFEGYLNDTTKVYNLQAIIEKNKNKLTTAEQDQLFIMQNQTLELASQKEKEQEKLEILQSQQEYLRTSFDNSLYENAGFDQDWGSNGGSSFTSEIAATEERLSSLNAQLQNLIPNAAPFGIIFEQAGEYVRATSSEIYGIENAIVECTVAYDNTVNVNEKIRRVLAEQNSTVESKKAKILEIINNAEKEERITQQTARVYREEANAINTSAENQAEMLSSSRGLQAEMAKTERATRNVASAMGASEEHLDSVRKGAIAVLEQQEKVNQAVQRYNNSLQDVVAKFTDFSSKTATIGGTLAKSFSGLSTIAMGINSISNAISTLGDDSASVGQKFISFTMALTMGFSALKTGISGITGIIDIINAKSIDSTVISTAAAAAKKLEADATGELTGAEIKNELITSLANATTKEEVTSILTKIGVKNAEAVAEQFLTIKKEEGTVAAIKATVANLGLASAEAAVLWPLLAIAAAMAAVAVVAYVLVKAYNADADAAERAAEASKKMAEEAEEAKNKAESLKSAIEGYDSAVATLNDCVKGTQEWKEAFKEVQEAALEVLNITDDLSAETVQGLASAIQSGDQGQISKAMAAAQSEADLVAQNASYAASSASYEASQAQIGSDARDLARKIDGYTYNAATDMSLSSTTIKGILLNHLDELGETMTVSEFGEKLSKEVEEFGGNLSGVSDDTLAIWQSSVQEMAASADTASAKLNAIASIQVENALVDSDYGDTEKAYATEALDARTKELADYYYDRMTGSGINRASSSNNEIYREMLGKLQEAGYDVSAQTDNAVRGTDSNRSLAFLNSEGKEVVYNAEQIASMIAAAEALEEIGANAEKAATLMNNYTGQALENVSGVITAFNQETKEFDLSELASNLTEAEINTVNDAIAALGDDASNEDKAKAIADVLGITNLDEILSTFGVEDSGAQFAEAWVNGANNVLDSFTEEETRNLNNSNIDTSKSTIAEQKAFASAKEQAGQNLIDKTGNSINFKELRNIENENTGAIDELTDFYNALAQIDVTSENATEQVQTLVDQYELEGDAVEDFINQIDQLPKSFDVSSAAINEQAATLNEIAKDLEIGDTVDQDDIDNLQKAGIDTSKYFTMMADGSYALTGAAEEFKQIVKSITFDSLKEQVLDFDRAKSQVATGKFYDAYLTDTGVVAGSYEANNGSSGYIGDTSSENLGRARLDYINQFDAGSFNFNNEQQGLLNAYQSDSNLELDPDQLQLIADMIDIVNQKEADLEAQLFTTATTLAQLDEAALALGTYDYNAYAEGLINVASQYENCTDEIEEYQKALLTSDIAQIKAAEDNLRAATVIGEAAEKYDLESDVLEAQAKRMAKEYGISAEAAANLAVKNQRMNKGVSSLVDNWSDWKKQLSSSNKLTQDYAEAVVDCTAAIADLVGASDDLELPDEFFNAENMALIEQAINGDTNAINKLGAAVGESIVGALEYNEAFANLAMQLEEFNGLDLSGVDLSEALGTQQFLTDKDLVLQGISDIKNGLIKNGQGMTDDWVAALNRMALTTGMSVEEMNSLLGSIGVQAKVETTYVKQPMEVPTYTEQVEGLSYKKIEAPRYDENGEQVGSGYVMVPEYTKATVPGEPVTVEGYAAVAQISTEDNPLTVDVNESTAGGNPPDSSATYSSNRGTISQSALSGSGSGGGGSSSSSKPAEKKKESDVLDRYKEITDVLDDVTRATERASKAADRLYGKSRIDAMKQANASLQQEISLLKQKKSEAESYLSIDQQALDAAASAAGVSFTYDSEGNISNYTSQMQALLNQYNALVDQVNADGDVSDEEQDQLDRLEELINELKEAISQYDDTRELIQDLDEQITDKFYEWQDNNYEILHYELEIEIELNDLQLEYIDYYLNKIEDDFYAMAEAAQYMTSQIPLMTDSLGDYENFYNKITQAYANGEISQADYVDGMKEAYSSILDQLQALNELDKEMMHYYEDTLDAASEELSKYTDRMEHLTSVLGHYKNLIELINGEYDYESIGKILDGQAKTLKNELDVLTANYKMLLTEKEAIEQSLANAQDDAARELFQEELDAINAAVDEAQENMLAKTEEWAEAQKAVMENAMAEAAAEMEKAFTDGMGFDALSNSLSRLSSYADEYLTKTNQMYETQKLINTAQQAADKSTNEAAKARLKAYTDEIEQLQNKNQLSNLELEIAKAKYDVVLAEIALEEAQNAKSTVRLQRDSEGNFGYVYTSDQEQISQAEQDLADAQNALYNIGLEGANEYGQKLLELKQQLADELVALEEARAAGQYATDEEYYAARDQLIQEYNDLFLAYSEQYTTALGVDTAIQEEAWVNAYENMINKTGDWQEKTQLYTEKCEEAFESWRDVVETESEVVDAILNDLESEVDDVTEASDELKNEVIGQVIPAMNNELVSVRNVTAAYAAQRAQIQELISYYEQLARSILEVIQAQSGLSGSSGSASSSNANYDQDFSALMNEAYRNEDWEAYEYYKRMREEKIAAGYSDYGVSTDWIDEYLKKHGYQEGANWVDIFNGGFASGGYTGSWGPEGKLTMLHEKELVLNADDTVNFLKGIDIIRSIADSIDLKALQDQVSILPYNPGAQVQSNSDMLEQNVHIEANFPNVQDRNEIQEAFNTLINKASQYANRK